MYLLKVLFLPTSNIPIIAHRKREEKLIEKCLETWPSPLSQPSRQPSVQGSKLTTMNLRVMPVALAENKTQPSGWVRSASGSDKKTAASRLRFEIYWIYSPPLLSLSLSLSNHFYIRVSPTCTCTYVCVLRFMNLTLDHTSLDRFREGRTFLYLSGMVLRLRCLMRPVYGHIRAVFLLPITFYGRLCRGTRELEPHRVEANDSWKKEWFSRAGLSRNAWWVALSRLVHVREITSSSPSCPSSPFISFHCLGL